MTDPEQVYEQIHNEVSTVLIGNEEVIEQLTIALFSDGHVLLEGIPGVAKTTIANLFSRVLGLEYNRIQMTPDLLPADITGTSIYREATGEFELQRGPIFSNVVLADEVNRATPKTQSALLEAMQERQVTIEGESLELPSPFLLIATQNPIEMEGTFELPEAQRDRFHLKISVSIPEREDGLKLLDQFDDDPTLGPTNVSPVVFPDDIRSVREEIREVYVAQPLKEYVLDIIEAVRESENVRHGGSPRASLHFLDTLKARAAIHGRTYVIPEDVTALAQSVLSHRLILSTNAELGELTAGDVVDDITTRVDPPGSPEELTQKIKEDVAGSGSGDGEPSISE